MIDLHSHTTFSDGQYSPDRLLELAAQAGVTVLAVTDHDTVAGLDDCAKAAAERGVRLVPGIEVSVMENRRELHVLGHFVDPRETRLAGFGDRLKIERRRRMEAMVQRINELGMPVTMDEVLAIAGEDANLARPHLARALVARHYCVDTREAFDRFLKDGGPAHVARFKVSAKDAIEMIHHAGGTASLAHPGVSKVDDGELRMLAAEGLDGIEVDHADHPPSYREKLLRLTEQLNLVATGGSDFHGEAVAPTRVFGKTSMRPAQFARLEARAAAWVAAATNS